MRLTSDTLTSLQDTLHAYETVRPSILKFNFYLWTVNPFLYDGAAKLSPFSGMFDLWFSPRAFLDGWIARWDLSRSSTLLCKMMDLESRLGVATVALYAFPLQAQPKAVPLSSTYSGQQSLSYTLVPLYIIVALWLGVSQNITTKQTQTAQNAKFFQLLMFTWVLQSIDKVETTEESVTLAMLWPWCFLIIFTHLMALADHTVMFGFSEWGLPVTYGLIMLTEHWWTMGTYFFIYVAGAVGRKSSLVTAIEDITAVAILVARVMLQAVRGVIVGMFHFICREMLWNMNGYWTNNNIQNSAISSSGAKLTCSRPVQQLLLDLVITGGSFVIITAIMFLQLLFLLVSVWLFCKCWFTSWRSVKVTKAAL